MFKKVFKSSISKILMMTCIVTMSIMVVGCSNDKSNYATSTNATSSNEISENSTEELLSLIHI